MIKQYLPKLFNLFKNLTDIRYQSYVIYDIKVHYFFIKFTHTIRQILELGHIPIQKLKSKKISHILSFGLISLTSILYRIMPFN